ncbi:MAG: ROK family protein, partial [Fimbriimonadales bacterium]
MAECVIGVDLGGTNVRAAAVGRSGELLSPPVQRPSRGQDGFLATLEQIVATVQEAASGARPLRIGVAAPGHIDSARGVVRWAPNLGEWREGIFEGWREVPIAEALQARLNLPV